MLADSVAELSIDIEDAEEEDSEDDEDNDGKSPKTAAAKLDQLKVIESTPVNKPGFKWVSTSKLPGRVYEKLRPKMAVSYPFELDEFQKQAVLRLERRENVFVAAHTSAGKTVVAEYAIALALKNNSRAVYTSPIKALSNQKYRDFKDKFGVDKVGIVTGDVSVNPQAQCLIMTTEIFRSMLYKGADTTRDIEFVIFDEVHYVNDAERGVVWEEVIIMLPAAITLIFLSATTPNASDFSDWIGRTKQKRVHLISTNKRPVPLQHYLYFDNEMYRLMEGDKNYNPAALAAANKRLTEKNKPPPKKEEAAKLQQQRLNEKAEKAAVVAGNNPQKKAQIAQAVAQRQQQHQAKPGAGRGGGGGSGPAGGGKGQWQQLVKILQAGGREAAGGLGEINFGVARARSVLSKEARRQKSEQQVKYESLPADLRAKMTKKEYEATEFRAAEDEADGAEGCEVGLLPVVVFSFSKKRCEELADFFKGQDFLSQKEKAAVHGLFDNVLQRLNPLDAQLPQINRLREMLLRGIGVHHGGLLPILKETVELLFTDSTVKVLFATETFAMGVNMPARAVVFNSFRKHDGREFRDLLSGEYIQMAGRAGRRGLDKFGTVIVTAWNDLPAEVTIRKLLTGRPTLLSSQFRLRYNMILNLVRVNNLSVAEMIKRSFTEFATQRQLAQSDIGTKLRKYELLTAHLEAQLLLGPDGQPAPSEAERGRRMEFVGLLRAYQTAFQSLQAVFFEQLAYLVGQFNATVNFHKRFDLNGFFSFGRVIQLQNAATGGPCWGLVLLDPAASRRQQQQQQAAAATKTAAVKKPAEMSAMAASRAALLGLAPAPGKSAPAAGAGRAGEKEDPLEEQFLWALCPLAENDLPAWAAEKRAAGAVHGQPTLDLSALREEVFGLSELSPFVVVKVALKDIGHALSPPLVLPSLAAAKSPAEAAQAAPLALAELLSEFILAVQPAEGGAGGLSYVDFQRECKVNALAFHERQLRLLGLVGELVTASGRLNSFATKAEAEAGPEETGGFYRTSRLFPRLVRLAAAERKRELLRHFISDENLSLFPDFTQRLNLLRSLGYLAADSNVITKKGRVCCELNTCDELLGTELLFHNVLEPLNPPEAAAILSALIFQEKNDVEEVLTTRMETARSEIVGLLHQLNTLQRLEGIDEYGLEEPRGKGEAGRKPSNNATGFVSATNNKPVVNFGLCAVVYQWARGVPFKEICQMTQFQEGSIVRTITRLDELCRDIQNAARVMGNPSLYHKMEAASQCIKRDIVFAASLYLVE